MKEIQPEFASKVRFVAVDIGYSDIKKLRTLAKDRDYPWSIGLADRNMLENFNVRIQSTKIAIDSNGVIIYRAGYGQGTIAEWTSVFGELEPISPN